MKRRIYLLVFLFSLAVHGNSTVFTVNSLANTNTGAGTSGTLRWCIGQANLSVGPHTINFSVAGTINIAANANALPALTRAITIDGTTAPGYAGNPVIIINGAGCTSINGLEISAANCNIYGLDITSFPYRGVHFTSDVADNCNFGANGMGNIVRSNSYYGVQLSGADNCILAYNRIGVNAAGACAANGYDGLDLIGNANNNQILNNHISCNLYNGLQIGNSDFNIVRGNVFGPLISTCTNNAYRGIDIEGGSNDNVIGGQAAGQGNRVSGNLYWGIEVKEAGSINNIISGNSISCNDYGGIEVNTGGNNNIAIPVITAANTTTVSGTSLANAIIEIFRAQDPGLIACPMAPTPNNQGIDYLGTTTANGAGNWTLAGTFNGTLVATQRNAAGNTSAFSNGVSTGAAPVFNTNCPGSIPVLGNITDYFSAQCQNGAAVLSWRISSSEWLQTRLERSSQNENFEVIAVYHSGDGEQIEFRDEAPLSGLVKYRLAAMDLNGGVQHTEVKPFLPAECGQSAEGVKIFPNPAAENLNVWLSEGIQGNCRFQLLNAEGKMIFSQDREVTDAMQILDISALSNGFYCLLIRSDASSVRQPFSVLK